MRVLSPQRYVDCYGAGHYGASRGSRTHNGVDYACYPCSKVYSPVYGEVTKLGYPYRDDLSFRYVQITTNKGYKVRVFYIEPFLALGDHVDVNTVIGESQLLGDRYPDITEHVHLEVKDPDGRFVNPKELGL